VRWSKVQFCAAASLHVGLSMSERSLEDSIEVDVVLRFVELACENVCFNRKEPAL
jgi:hypothetical protein